MLDVVRLSGLLKIEVQLLNPGLLLDLGVEIVGFSSDLNQQHEHRLALRLDDIQISVWNIYWVILMSFCVFQSCKPFATRLHRWCLFFNNIRIPAV
jgi:hypothetical protein